jgi:hypothetical protein
VLVKCQLIAGGGNESLPGVPKDQGDTGVKVHKTKLFLHYWWDSKVYLSWCEELVAGKRKTLRWNDTTCLKCLRHHPKVRDINFPSIDRRNKKWKMKPMTPSQLRKGKALVRKLANKVKP